MARPDYAIQRGEILRMLYRMYPDPVGDNVLRSTFVWITKSAIDGHVAYLADSGYATREEINHEQYEFSTAEYIVKITPRGIRLLEGAIEADPGIKNPPL